MNGCPYPGDELRRQREELGLSLQDVFAETHIPIVYIEAIENGDLESLPPLGYCVGFLRTYCNLLGLSPERYVDSLQVCARRAGRVPRTPGKSKRSPFPWYEDMVTWAAISAFLLLAWLTYAVVVRPQAGVDDKRVEADTREMVVPPASAEPPF